MISVTCFDKWGVRNCVVFVIANLVPSSSIRLEVPASLGTLNFLITHTGSDPVCPSSALFSMVQKKCIIRVTLLSGKQTNVGCLRMSGKA